MNGQMSLWDRTRLAVSVIRHGSRAVSRRSQKVLPFVWPTWVNGQPVWQMVDFQEYVDKGFNLNSVIYSAIMYKYRALTSAPLRAYNGDPEHPKRQPPGDPLAKLLLRPNPHQSSIEFGGQQIVYLNVSGNSYTYLDRGKQTRKPGESPPLPEKLWNLRPDRVFIVPGDGGIKGFMYKPQGKSLREAMPILPEDMMHVKLPNPGDPYEGMGYGLSPFSALAQSGDVDNSMTTFLKTLMDTKTMLGGLLKFNVPMTDDQVGDARRRWQEIYGGVDNWGEVAVLDNGGDFKPFTPDMEKLGSKSIDSRNEKRMVGPLGVPGMLIGLSMENSTFSNFEQADRVFWQNTFNPELSLFEVEYQHYLSERDVFPAYDKSGVPALQKNIPALVEAAHKMWSMGTPRDVAYTLVGLSVPETADGQTGYVPLNMVPTNKSKPSDPSKGKQMTLLGLPIKMVDEEPPKLSAAASKKSKWTSEQKQLLWKAFDNIATSWEDKFAEAAKDQFEADKREILALVSDMKEKSLRQKATINWLEMLVDVKAYLDGKGIDAWRTAFVPLLEGIIEDTGDYWSVQTGLAFNVRNLLAEAWFDIYKLQFAQPINQTTSDTIHAVLAQAQAEGWSIPTMQKNMEALFKQWMNGNLTADDFTWFADRMPSYRTELIARTETTHAENAGAYNLYKSWNVTDHEWLATDDQRTRDSHHNTNGQVKAIDEPFEVNGYKMQYPGDTSLGAPVGEIANCRCADIPVIPDEDVA